MTDLNKELLLEIFYSTRGDLDKINAAIESRLQQGQTRKISIFEKYIKSRLSANPRVLKMAGFSINPLEAVYLSQYPAIAGVEILDLRKNSIGDEGLNAIAHSPLLKNLRELDLRNNQISRVAMEIADELIENGEVERGWLGIGIQPLTPELAITFKADRSSQGVLVNSVDEGAPAQMSGLRQGDIILSYNGNSALDTNSLQRLVAGTEIGQVALIKILRQGREKILHVKVGKLKS